MARPKKYMTAEAESTSESIKNTISGIDPASLPPEQRAIAERINSQDDGWRSPITEDDVNDFSLSTHKLDLPPDAKRLRETKQFAFRWATCSPKRVDELTRSLQRPERWWVVTRDFCLSNAKGMLAEIDDIHGGIVRIGQILLFKPFRDFQIVQKAKQDLAAGTEAGLGIDGAAARLSNPDEGIEAMAGKKHRVKGSDVVLAAEDVSDVGVAGDDSGGEAEE